MRHGFLRVATVCLLALSLLFSLLSCGDDNKGYYPEVKSSSSFRKTVLEIGGEDVSFELVRFFFWRHIDEVDGGDRNRWAGEEHDTLLNTAMEKVIADIAEIYAVFRVYRDWGLDPESDDIDDMVNEYVKLDVDGGDLDDDLLTGFDSYDDYLGYLSTLHSTDTVNRLLYRYAACLSSLYTYVVTNRAEGKATVTEDALTDFYFSDECAYVNCVSILYAYYQYPDEARAAAEKIHAAMTDAGNDYDKLVEVGFAKSHDIPANPALGDWYGRYSSDDGTDARYQTVFSLRPGELSPIIETPYGFYIYYGMEKSTQDLEAVEARERIEALYFDELCHRSYAETAAELLGQVTCRSAYHKITFETLSKDS